MAVAAASLDPAQAAAPTPTRHRAPRTGGRWQCCRRACSGAPWRSASRNASSS